MFIFGSEFSTTKVTLGVLLHIVFLSTNHNKLLKFSTQEVFTSVTLTVTFPNFWHVNEAVSHILTSHNKDNHKFNL